MSEPTDREYNAAKRVVAKVAKAVRETSGNPTVRGHLVNAYVDEGYCSFYLSANYAYLKVRDALEKVEGVREVGALRDLTVEGVIDVAYPKEK